MDAIFLSMSAQTFFHDQIENQGNDQKSFQNPAKACL